MVNFSRAGRRIVFGSPGHGLLRIAIAAGALSAGAPAGVRAGPDPCSGVGTVTCSGNQSDGIDTTSPGFPPGTTVLNVNSLTRDIDPDPAIGQPGILFFGTGNISLVSATGPFAIIQRGDFTDGIVAESDGAVRVTTSGRISIRGIFANGINVISDIGGPITIASSSDISLTNGGDAISADTAGGIAVSSSGALSIAGDGIGISASAGVGVVVNSSGSISIGGSGTAIDATDRGGPTAGGGVTIVSSGDISIAGSSAIGINAASEDIDRVNVTSSGRIALANGGNAILAFGSGPVEVGSSGAISIAGGPGGGIVAASNGTGAVVVNSSGGVSIDSDGVGIIGASAGGSASVVSLGNIRVGGSGLGISAIGGSAANVTSSGSISLGGDGSAISAISDTGPANVTSSGNISLGGDGAGIGAFSDSGPASVTSSGNIFIGGEGAAIDVEGKSARVASSGDVTAAGPGSTAILASALKGTIAVEINGGTVTGGSGAGAGVALIGGRNNTLANFGTITTSAGLSGTAIRGAPSGPALAGAGNNTVNNAGTIIGNIDLGSGRNAFNNLPGGTLISGAAVNIGAGNRFDNRGTLSPGGAGVFQTTTLTGNITQGGAGRIAVDLDPASGRADRINVTGSAKLGGRIALNLTSTTPTVGTASTTLVHAGGGAADNGLTLGPLPAVAFYQLEFPNGSDVVLQGGLNFAPPGLNANQAAIGGNINAIQLAGGSASFLPVVRSILTIPDVSKLGQAYNQLSPEIYGDDEIGELYSGLRFANSLMSCEVADGRYAFIKEGQCVWAQIGGRFMNLGAGSGQLPFSESAVAISGGAEIMLQPDWFAGFAVGYDNGSADTDSTRASSQAERAHFGAVVKYNPGPFLFAAAVYGGYGWYSTDRVMDFGGFDATATSDSRISRVGGQLRAAYLIDRETWYLKPLLDLNVTRVSLNGFRETGAGGAGLVVSGTGETVFSASPAIEIGTQTRLQGDALLRPFARLGLTAFSNTDFAVSAGFSGAPAGVAPFSVTTGIDSLTANVAAGADLFLPGTPWVFKIAYSGHYGARVRDQGFGLKASIHF